MVYHKWTDREYKLLVIGVRMYKEKWEMLRQHLFPAMSVVQLKNKFYSNPRNMETKNQPLNKQQIAYYEHYAGKLSASVSQDSNTEQPAQTSQVSQQEQPLEMTSLAKELESLLALLVK